MTMMTQDVCDNLFKIDSLRNDIANAVGALYVMAEGCDINTDVQKGVYFVATALRA